MPGQVPNAMGTFSSVAPETPGERRHLLTGDFSAQKRCVHTQRAEPALRLPRGNGGRKQSDPSSDCYIRVREAHTCDTRVSEAVRASTPNTLQGIKHRNSCCGEGGPPHVSGDVTQR